MGRGNKKFRGGGRGRGGGGGRGRGGGGGGGRGGDRDRDGGGYRSHSEIKKENERLERFYNSALPLEESERAEFWAALRRELPNSFRFCGSKGHALAVKRLLETRYIPEIVKIERYDGEPVQAPQAVPWFPDLLAYSMNTPKHVIRKFPPFAAFQKFLVSETSVGNISRQEIVSMIPPLLMDLKPGMTCLDLCAAPGSKAAQLLEMIHVGEETRMRKVMESFGEVKPEATSSSNDDVDLSIDSGDDGRATGLLIANDADYKRSHMLVHQLKRLSSPNLLVTNHDATLYPSLRLPRDPAHPEKGNYLKFDRILADVPCSGDGTLRKNVELWRNWQPGSALGLHTTQVRILVRALQMLKPGGRVVYSTCSMNPIENEAVVVSAIERCGGPAKVEIVDCRDRLPALKRVPGMHQWKIMDKSGRVWSSWEEVQQYALTQADGVIPGKVTETMFARPDSSECSSLPLDRCMRVYAHQQDTGGFFITVLEKKGEIKAKPEAPPRGAQTSAATTTANGSSEAAKPEAEEGEDALAADEAEAKMEVVKETEELKAAVGEPTDVLPAVGEKRPLDEEEDADQEQAPEAKKQRTVEPEDGGDDVPESGATTTAVDTPNNNNGGDDDNSAAATPAAGATPITNPNQARRRGADGAYEEPFKYLPLGHEIINNIEAFYKISPRFPSDRYMVRNATGEPAKAIYYTSALLRDILVENEGRGVKFVHGGVKMFMKQDAPSAEVCRWRIQSEGMPIISGYVGAERVVTLTSKETFRTLLKEMFPKFINEDWRKLGEIGERAKEIGMGCCILKVEPDGSDPDFAEKMVLPLWKSFHSLNLMLPKEDRSAMLLRIFNDTSPVINQSLKDSAASAAAKKDGAAQAPAEEADSGAAAAAK
ncbi:S-adenosyl-L-methionine-dependent methyltransferase [Microdochium trichocladiopsis]|uniref:S-adenosyl-L-methionine-dependent methyltransferase n=1 Tax=Microdochium trichocladiopsis TaxID=1682393 RepID=A0A9P8Y6U3_9PEZI|nr:S-adenosyl-L-methionine-dependent methyltransferase [Microdochium trichocladiopsis]KAH7031225.1 S-adenosyl-L-methionine-dependent methyltransferase [Microdochium trichocladiopsis]